MLPDPLHPAVVHFPLVLAMLLPLFALGAVWSIARGARPRRAWMLPLAFSAALLASAFVATRTGEAEEERVENAVAESALHEHEEAAEQFLLLSGIVLLVAGFGLMRGNLGTAARLMATAGALVLVVAGVRVGAAGGELVYGGNAGSAYASMDAGNAAPLQEQEDDD